MSGEIENEWRDENVLRDRKCMERKSMRRDERDYMEELDEAESIPDLDEPADRDCPEADPPDGVWVVKDSSRDLQQGKHFPKSPAHFAATFLLTQ